MRAVYVMQDLQQPLVKVGFSSHVEDRRKQLQREYRTTIKIVYKTKLVWYFGDLEAQTHKQLQEFLVAEEWYRCTAEHAVNVLKSVQARIVALEQEKLKPRKRMRWTREMDAELLKDML